MEDALRCASAVQAQSIAAAMAQQLEEGKQSRETPIASVSLHSCLHTPKRGALLDRPLVSLQQQELVLDSPMAWRCKMTRILKSIYIHKMAFSRAMHSMV